MTENMLFFFSITNKSLKYAFSSIQILNETDELFKIKLLIEKSNIKYANLLSEFDSKGKTRLTIDECKTIMKKTVDNEILDKIFNILLIRGYIKITEGMVSLMNRNFVNRETQLDSNDEYFARHLLSIYGNYHSL